ncbi:SIS domain-containing protein [Streptomyces sp. TRM66268-LWL]|uniref:SIS domain-containing protein n=1 Tax=Streptomyces polyasparticus TaxID=2767826 RepID=A0ABR7SHG2_9ACTN|nr:SIS domain-containing protein [Streptomyces polyasparticus]MBC9713921.1 SIS domain-containing protein [Streptomyces polyasparticus]
MTETSEAWEGAVHRVFARREPAVHGIAEQDWQLGEVCRDMAARFRRGGRLITFGNGAAATDASHLAVEFLHPAVVGKRALPAMALGNDAPTLSGIATRDGIAATFEHQLRAFAGEGDIALGISPDGRCRNVHRAVAAARELGLLTVVLSGGVREAAPAADHLLVARSADPLVVKEVHMTYYHLLWELTQIILERHESVRTA